MYQLYGKAKTRSTRVAWLLEEIGLPWQFIPTSPHADELVKHSPLGKLPVLITPTGKALTESVAILVYLTEKYQFSPGIRIGTVEMAGLNHWVFWSVTELESPVWLLTRNKFLLVSPPSEDLPAICINDIQRAIAYLSLALGDKSHVMGEVFTHADILIAQTLMWVELFEIEIEQENVRAYLVRCKNRPAFRRALAKELAVS
ncbi:MAG: glutathione S-transferase family protein [Ostreibacterium sp.]